MPLPTKLSAPTTASENSNSCLATHSANAGERYRALREISREGGDVGPMKRNFEATAVVIGSATPAGGLALWKPER